MFFLHLNQRARFYERDVDGVADFPGAGVGRPGQVQLADVHQAVLARQELGDHAKLLHLHHLCVPGQPARGSSQPCIRQMVIFHTALGREASSVWRTLQKG